MVNTFVRRVNTNKTLIQVLAYKSLLYEGTISEYLIDYDYGLAIQEL